MSAPTTTTKSTTNNVNESLINAKNVAADKASAAYNAAANSNLANGPVAENVKDQAYQTSNEFSNLKNARTTPTQPAATGQQLTHYHSFFSALLSWENPRASGIAYVATVAFIFGARYLNLLRYAFKLTWMTLGITVAAEVAGKILLSHGLVTQIRPKKYFVLPKEAIDATIGDVHELINFFVIEAQRIVFAENVFASAAAFLAAFFSYFLIKIVPFWGLSLIATTVLFIVPLIYTSNQELIDSQIANVSSIVNQQTAQVKELASHHASVALDTTKQYAGDYSAKAQEIIGSRARSTSPVATTKPVSPATPIKPITPVKQETATYHSSDFPAAPKVAISSDFPVAPKDDLPIAKEFIDVPSVGATASTLRDENEPLIST